jgi:membrane-bound ClpP family serine protease
MDLLTNPNVAYLLLLTFLWISMLAVLSPGSGILEIVALFALVLAGLGVYTNPVNWWALALLAFVALPLMVLVFKTRRLLFLGLSIAALVVSSAYLFELANAIRIVPEYQRLVVFRLGRCVGAKGPGIVLLIPVIDRAVRVTCASRCARSRTRLRSPRITPHLD